VARWAEGGTPDAKQILAPGYYHAIPPGQNTALKGARDPENAPGVRWLYLREHQCTTILSFARGIEVR
jgi:hypothetical protein